MGRSVIIFITLLAAAGASAGNHPHLLVTNDDGIHAPGIAALVDALRQEYRITVVAPATQQSGMGHGITFLTPVLVEELPALDGIRRNAVHAQPATSVRIGLSALLLDDPPDLVVSGINHGDNAGRSVWLSGTVAAAREAALAGFPAVAFSAARPPGGGDPDFAAGAQWARQTLTVLRGAGLPRPGTLVKVELPHPAGQAIGIVVTNQGLEPPREERYVETAGPKGERLYVSHWQPPAGDSAGTDAAALAAGFVTVTPLSLDQTDYRRLPELASLPWLPAREPQAGESNCVHHRKPQDRGAEPAAPPAVH